LEAEARPVRRLVAALIPFDDGVLWSSAVERPLSSRLQLSGAAVRAYPWPDLGRRIRRSKLRKMVMLLGLSTTAASGVGPLGPAIGDFPFAGGLLPLQGVKRSSCDGAPPTALWCWRSRLAEGLGCNFFLSLWTFLYFCQVNISFFLRKKKKKITHSLYCSINIQRSKIWLILY
jgi:hypothetical protein